MRNLTLTTAVALLTTCAAQPAYAQEVTLEENIITFENQYTVGTPHTETYVFGDVVILHTRRPNNLYDHDSIEVLQVPDGYIAVPYSIDVLEGDTGFIDILPYVGF